MAGAFAVWKRRPTPPGGSSLTRLVGWGLVVGALVFFFLVNKGGGPVTLGFDGPGLVERWNTAAVAAGRPELSIDSLVDTETPGVVGHAFSPDLRVIARTAETGGGEVVELVAVGNPGRDGMTDVTAVFDLVVRVVAPSLDESDRAGLLSDLGVTSPNPPAQLRSTVPYDRFEFRATSNPDTGEIGIGVAPVLPG